MAEYSITLDAVTAAFYRRVAESTGLPVERVLSDTLFKLAGELALESLAVQKKHREGSR